MSIQAMPSGEKRLCVFTGTPAPTSLATMPNVKPDPSECSNGGSSSGMSARLIGGPMQNVPVYHVSTDGTKWWKLWIVQLKTSTDSGNSFEFALVPNATAVPDTDAPPTPMPAIPTTPVPDTDVPDTDVPDTDAPDTAVPDTPVPPGATAVPDTPAPATPEPPPQARACMYHTAQLLDIKFTMEVVGSSLTLTLTGKLGSWFGVGVGKRFMKDAWGIVSDTTGTNEYQLGHHVLGTKLTGAGWSQTVQNGYVTLTRSRSVVASGGEYYGLDLTKATVDVISACGNCYSNKQNSAAPLLTTATRHGPSDTDSRSVAWGACVDPTPTPPATVDTPQPQTPRTPVPPVPVTPEPGVRGAGEGDDGGCSKIAGLCTLTFVLIVVGVVLLLCSCAGLAFFLTKKKKAPPPPPEEDEVNELEQPLLGPDGVEAHESEMCEKQDDDGSGGGGGAATTDRSVTAPAVIDEAELYEDDDIPTPQQKPAPPPSLSDDDDYAVDDLVGDDDDGAALAPAANYSVVLKSKQSAQLSDLGGSEYSVTLPSEHDSDLGGLSVEQPPPLTEAAFYEEPALQQLRHTAGQNEEELAFRGADGQRIADEIARQEERVEAVRREKNLPQNGASLLASPENASTPAIDLDDL